MTDSRRTVRLTRRRWDVYMAPLLITSIAVGIYAPVVTGELRFVVAPVLPILLWLLLRFRWPKTGSDVPTIKGTPGAVPMLCLLASVTILFTALILIDTYLIGHHFYDPLKPYHAILMAPPFILMFGGAHWIDKKYRPQRKEGGA